MNPEPIESVGTLNKEKLQAEFHPGVLKKKKAQGGRWLSYIPVYIVIERLNDAVGVGEWSWRVTQREILGEMVIVFGELQVNGQVFSGEDAHEVTQLKNGNGRAPDALANAIKSASSGALVRAARLLGIGLYLYRNGQLSESALEERDEERDEEKTQARPAKKEQAKPRRVERHQLKEIASIMKVLGWTGDQVRAAANGKPSNKLTWDEAEALIKGLKTAIKAEKKEGASVSKEEALPPCPGGPSAKSSKLTERQFKAVEMITRSIGWTTDALRLHCTEVYNAPLEELSKDDAGLLIGELQKITAKGVA